TVPVLDKNGGLVFADGYLLDITRRKQVEDALRESEGRLRRIGDNLPNGALYQIVISPEGKRKYTYISAGAERMLGYSIEALMADADLAYNSVLEADVPELLAVESKAWAELSVFQHTVRVVTTTGELRWIHCQSAPQRNPDGSTVWDGVVIDITQSRYAEESLKRSERFLNAVFENSPVAMEVFSPDGYLLRINPAMSRFLGHSDAGASAIGKYNILTDPVAQSLNSPTWFKRALQGETVEARSQTVDLKKVQEWSVTQRVVYYDVAFVPIADDSGMVTNVVVMIWDITAQKEAERALRQKEQLLQQAAKIAKIGGWELNIPAQKLSWSEETYRIKEVESKFEPSIESAINFYAPEVRPVIRAAVEKGIYDGEGFDLELPLITGTGKLLWVRALGEPEFENGVCVRLAGALQDITERKITELALKASEERFREILNALPQLVGLVDRELRYQFVNKTYLTFFQVEETQIQGKTLPEVIGAKAFSQLKPLIERVLSNEVVHFCQSVHFRHVTAWLDGYLIPHRSTSGEVIGYFAVITDVTQFKEAETALRENAETYQTLLNTTMDGFCIVDSHEQY
ncbi:MAG TPA: PAS domain S-box protein, partial [Acidobacteriota bacterium]|nr:PAS domain S-box protein [Acidobacteriota bacterium]